MTMNFLKLLIQSTKWQAVLLGTLGVLIALVLIVLGLDLAPLTVIVGAFAMTLYVASYLLTRRLGSVREKTLRLQVQLTLEGVAESEIADMIKATIDIKNNQKNMLRRLGNIRDSAARSRLFLEIKRDEQKADQILDNLELELKAAREFRLKIADMANELYLLEEELDRLRRQTSYIYAAQKSLQELLTSASHAEKEVRKLAPI